MSQDKCRFMQNAEETVELKNGHYQISVTIQKSSGLSTKQHVSGYAARKLVEKKLEREPRLLKDYKAFMEDLRT